MQNHRTSSLFAFAVALALAATPSIASAAPPAGYMSNLPPLGREGAALIADATRDRMLLVTGSDGNLGYPSVYARALDGSGEWVDLRPGAGPGPRAYSSIVLDTVHDQVVLFGGRMFTTHGPWLNDVWVLPLGGSGQWTQVVPSGTAPIARSGACAVFDPVTQRMFVYGGEDRADSDTWALDLSGAPAWVPITATGPPTRTLASAIFDPTRRRMVMFGGQRTQGGSGYYNEVWTLSLDNPIAWTLLATAAGPKPGARFGQVAIYEPNLDAMIVQGGQTSVSIEEGAWKLSFAPATPAWSGISAGGKGPGARSRAGAIFDAARSRMVVVGGVRIGPSLQFVPLESSISALSTGGGTYAWTQLDSRELMPLELDLCGHRSVWDAKRDRMLTFFGRLGDGPRAMQINFSGGPSAWTEAGAGSYTFPTNRGGAGCAYDPVRDRVLCYSGGEGPVLYGFAGWWPFPTDLWAFNMWDGDFWEQLPTSAQHPTGRTGSAMCYDPVRDRMLLMGGQDSLHGNNDVWELPLSGPSAMQWSPLTPIGGPPLIRESFIMTYDGKRDRIVVSGGRMTRNDTGMIDDVWVLTLGSPPTWTQVVVPDMPTVGRNAGLYDPVRDRLLTISEDVLNIARTASLTFDPAPAWTVETPAGDRTLTLEQATMVYDAKRDRALLYGGEFEHRLLFELDFGTPKLARISTADPGGWIPGATQHVPFTVTNPFDFAQSFDWKATNARGWGGQRSGVLTVAANDFAVLEVAVAVPDSAAPGINALRVTGTMRTVLQALDATASLHDVTTGVLASLASASAEPGRVRLAWVLGDAASGSVVAVQRREVSSPWATVATRGADGSGWVRFEDGDVVAGSRYGYRLGFAVGATAGETWIDVPNGLDFALVGARPNPNDRELMMAFRLPTSEPARIELVDLAGRVVRSESLARPEPGAHYVPMDPQRRLPAGLYFARLTQGASRQVQKVTVVR